MEFVRMTNLLPRRRRRAAPFRKAIVGEDFRRAAEDGRVRRFNREHHPVC